MLQLGRQRPPQAFEFGVRVLPGPRFEEDFPARQHGGGLGTSAAPSRAVLEEWLDGAFGEEWLRAVESAADAPMVDPVEGYLGSWWASRSTIVVWDTGAEFYYKAGGPDHHDLLTVGRPLLTLNERAQLAFAVCRLALEVIAAKHELCPRLPAGALSARTASAARHSAARMIREDFAARAPRVLDLISLRYPGQGADGPLQPGAWQQGAEQQEAGQPGADRPGADQPGPRGDARDRARRSRSRRRARATRGGA